MEGWRKVGEGDRQIIKAGEDREEEHLHTVLGNVN
jgi:hypothetical protein